jgi:hypothetical protein
MKDDQFANFDSQSLQLALGRVMRKFEDMIPVAIHLTEADWDYLIEWREVDKRIQTRKFPGKENSQLAFYFRKWLLPIECGEDLDQSYIEWKRPFNHTPPEES